MLTLQETAPSLWGWDFNESSAIYDPGIPHQRTGKSVVYSSCGNKGQSIGPETGFACPHLMLYSTDMLLAAKYDKLDDHFLYGVCGSSTDYDCGKCFQVLPLHPETQNQTTNQQLILQIVNSGFDVEPGHFDVYMGAGGFGFYTSCNKDCKTKYCDGGACVEGMYDGLYDDWNPFSKSCYGGGVRMVNNNNTDELAVKCHALSGQSTDYKDKVLFQSCIESNTQMFHQNFIAANSLPIKCPEGLVRLTGLRRADEEHFPIAHIDNQFSIKCKGSIENHSYCISTMSDCCIPSCYWMNKGQPDLLWNHVDSCKRNGMLYDYV